MNIAIIDSKQYFRKVLRNILTNIGGNKVRVTGELENCSELLKFLEKRNLDIVFMDVKMPLMECAEITKKALSIYPHLVIIAMSAYDEEEYIRLMMDAGVRGYLSKNLNNQKLLSDIIHDPYNKWYVSEKLSAHYGQPV